MTDTVFFFSEQDRAIFLRIAAGVEEGSSYLNGVVLGIGTLSSNINDLIAKLDELKNKEEAIIHEIRQFNAMAFNREHGLWVNDQIYEDEDMRPVYKAAFNVAMEENDKINAIKEKIKQPIDWSLNEGEE